MEKGRRKIGGLGKKKSERTAEHCRTGERRLRNMGGLGKKERTE